jgi:hypothetical protein
MKLMAVPSADQYRRVSGVASIRVRKNYSSSQKHLGCSYFDQANCHREEHCDVAISWRTGFRSQRDCFATLWLAMTAMLFVESRGTVARSAFPRQRPGLVASARTGF